MRRRLVVILNPLGGGRHGRRVLRAARPRVEAAGYTVEVHETRAPGHAVELAASLALEEADTLCAAGGDGTLHEVVNGWLGRTARNGQPLGLLPAGSGNSVARTLGMADPRVAAARIVAGRRRPVDLLRLRLDGRERWAVNVVGWGSLARISRRAERLRPLRGQRYNAAALAELARPGLRPIPVRMEGLPGALRAEGAWLLGAACVTRYAGKGMDLAPHAEPGSGEVALVLVRQGPRPALTRLLLQVLQGAHLGSPLVAACRVPRLRVELPAGEDLLVVDGEILHARRVDLAVVPERVAILS